MAEAGTDIKEREVAGTLVSHSFFYLQDLISTPRT